MKTVIVLCCLYFLWFEMAFELCLSTQVNAKDGSSSKIWFIGVNTPIHSTYDRVKQLHLWLSYRKLRPMISSLKIHYLQYMFDCFMKNYTKTYLVIFCSWILVPPYYVLVKKQFFVSQRLAIINHNVKEISVKKLSVSSFSPFLLSSTPRTLQNSISK